MIEVIIPQLRVYATIFTHDGAPQVAGAAQWAQAQDQVFLPQPAAYVVPLSQDPGENTDLSGLTQIVRERYGVIVDFDNRLDLRGQAVAETFDAVRASIFAALLNWRPEPYDLGRGFRYAGGDAVEPFNRQRLCYQFEFEIERTITEGDGWQDQPIGPLQIEGTLIDPTSGEAGASFEVQAES